MMKVRWGVIGCGGIAKRRTIPGMLLSENSELVAVMDSCQAVAEEVKKEFGAKYAFDNEDELLALDEIDAVYIASPVFCHKEQAIKAAEAKKHILLEKPMGLVVEEAIRIKAACKKNGVKLGVGLMMRFSAYHSNVVSMRAQLTCWYPEINGSWRQDKAKSGGGALMDMGIHCVDLLQYISGDVAESVCCFAQNQTFGYSADDSAALLMKMSGGATAFVDANFNIPDEAAKCRLEFYGTKGSILAEGTISQVESGNVFNRTSDNFLKVEVTPGNMYEKEITSFANAIINDTAPEITAEDAIFVQRVVEKAYEASEKGMYMKV